MAALSLSPSPPVFFTPKACNSLDLSILSPKRTSSAAHFEGRTSFPLCPGGRVLRKRSKIWRVSATSGYVLPSETTVENAQQIIQSDEGGASTVISALLFVAFVGLTILTIGVIYIGVTDFLQKREREKFETEEAAKKSKKKDKRGPVRARAGPRGFGQKVDEEDED